MADMRRDDERAEDGDLDRDARAVALAESLWPNRYVGDLTRHEWDRVYHLIDRCQPEES
jgi:hypothetical protein